MAQEHGMQAGDRTLIWIVLGALLLVAVTLIVTLTRPEPAYQAEDTPEGVAHNYLLALQRRDFERAYGYLSPDLLGLPNDADALEEDARRYSWRFPLSADATLSIVSADLSDDRATVTVRETRFVGGELFDSSERLTTFEMTLMRGGDGWYILDADQYFATCWSSKQGCR